MAYKLLQQVVMASRHVGARVVWWVLCLLFCFAAKLLGAEALSDRLDTPSFFYPHPERSLFLDFARSGTRIVAVGERGTILYSDDEGDHWTQAEVPVSSMLTSVHFPQAGLGWAVGHHGVILVSRDNGQTWIKQLDGWQINDMVLQAARHKLAMLQGQYERANEDDRYELEYALEDAEFLLSDADLDADMGPSKPLLDVWFASALHGFAVGAYGLLLETQNGGESWSYIGDRLANLDRLHLNAIAYSSSSDLLIAAEAGALFASSDQGFTWRSLDSPYEGSLFGLQARDGDAGMFVYGLRGRVFYSLDAGDNWLDVSLDSRSAVTASTLGRDQQLYLVGLSGLLAIAKPAQTRFQTRPTDRFVAYTAALVLANGQLLLASEQGILSVSVAQP